ncbi:hypothetical protein NW755_004123 [Fusarium falciforme]|uniref:ABC transporter domain-containing protein n=1 Tax=Fusarium falciforme TaxID=195108 RepID=A0A9W8R9G7_9HYPO|nr:hypothetical protein NW755_004123 [Fusarium falciforme]KAJ4243404.1 hypothetical protein NW757_011267 [Fusarium falciforme]
MYSNRDDDEGPGLSDEGIKAVDSENLASITRIATGLKDRHIPLNDQDDEPNPLTDPRLDPRNPEFDHYRFAQSALNSLSQSGIILQRQGVVFSNLCVSGGDPSLQIQETVVSALAAPFRRIFRKISQRRVVPRSILRGFDGLLQSGELLLVLGRPGSGCTTLMRTLCGHLEGLKLDAESQVQYKGISFEEMTARHRADVAYNEEMDVHFPHLTVGETLAFAAAARTPHHRPHNLSRDEYVSLVVQLVEATFGLTHTHNTKVGDEFVRGVSGGERKRVSIAEMFLSRARIGMWDNSTRGLDAASALQFIKSLRRSAEIGKACHAVAAYQSSQSMYDLFHKVVVLYEGHQVFFGPTDRAVDYFQEMGWNRDPRQMAPDFLTAVTNPFERRPRSGMEEKVPRSPAEFEAYWRRSPDYETLKGQIRDYQQRYSLGGAGSEAFRAHHVSEQARHTRDQSPYLLSVPMQIRLCLKRAGQRLRNDKPTTLSTVVIQIVLALVIGSIFYNTPDTSDAFFSRGAVLFFAVLMNALITINEIVQLYAQKLIVEKQARYAFVHPFTEALAGILVELPIKLFRCSVFSIILYFMANLRREPAQFFIFYLFLLVAIFTMSAIFRTLAAVTRTVGQAMSLAGVLVMFIVVYTGFTIPMSYMKPWFSWFRWINPVFYAFEALISNEFHGRNFECAQFVPHYGTGKSVVCAVVGAVAGDRFISGDNFILESYGFTHAHMWRNFGILIALMIAFHVFYLVAVECNSKTRPRAQAPVFRPGHAPSYLRDDVESVSVDSKPNTVSFGKRKLNLTQHKDTLLWKGVCYDVPTKEGTRRLLEDVNGWVKPGTLTALMGVSGAGKTTLLDVLAQRASLGVVKGDITISGERGSLSLPRRTGYVQQHDLHLETTTVREALRFSAMLRQPQSVSVEEKNQCVEEVLQLLGMEEFAEAIVGLPGQGLNVEQRKLLSIGVELAAKPSLLIFLDEPTSGLDSQSSWTICALLRSLADKGQAILATIHQPNALLFQTFDRLLFLAKGGRTVYFGDIGPDSQLLLSYFVRNGARPCAELENPAEYILETVSGAAGPDIDWPAKWNQSEERRKVLLELDRLEKLPGEAYSLRISDDDDDDDREFAMPFPSQFRIVVARAFQQYFRQPEYIYSKFILGTISGLFIGFSFWKTDHSQQGFQNSLFSVFLLCISFSTLVNQVMPKFVAQRSLYEVRERPSRVYSWKVFILSQMLVEVPWQIFVGVCAWASFFYSVFGTNISSESQGIVLLFIVQFYIYAASLAQMVVAALPNPSMGAMFATLMFGLSFVFNGVMQPPDALPRFWIFMYHVSPFTYYVAGISSVALSGREVQCSEKEMIVLDPPPQQTCGEYLAEYVELVKGQLYNPDATSGCQFCSMSSADQYLLARKIHYDQRWRNYGIFCSYFVFNIFVTVFLYYAFRVRGFMAKVSK